MRRVAPKGVAGAAAAGKKHHPICCTGFANLNARGGKGTGQLEKYAELAKCDFFFLPLLAKLRPGLA